MAAPPSLSPGGGSNPKTDLLLKIIFAIIAGTAILFLRLDYLESYFYDLRVTAQARLGFAEIQSSHIALIFINSKTVEKLQSYPTYSEHTILLEKLEALKPKYIVYDFRIEHNDLADIPGSEEEKVQFAQAAIQFNNLIFMTPDLKMKGEEERLQLNPPLDRLVLASSTRPSDINLFAKDGVSRRIMIQYQNQAMLQPTLASYYNPSIQDLEKIHGTFTLLDSLQLYIHFHPLGSFPTYSFEDVIDGKIPPDAFKDKLILVGTDTGKTSKDYALTPYTREVNAMTSTELHANQFQTLIDNNAPIKVPKLFDIILTLMISILTVYVTLALKPSQGLLILTATLIGLAVIILAVFIGFGWWVDFAHPFLSIFLCYYFFIPYRLIKENRRSWEYYQKHLLLSQVEELKTNFISMMSHDLKTPIARIQGMTEVIFTDTQPLSNHQRDALDTIRSSSDDLLKFINSILQYGRIESEGVVLHKQSKDINQLLLDVIKKHDFLAKVKKIKIHQEFEPLFPVAVDPELIKQVFSNLLENAIKYSPDESTVWVKTRETDGSVFIEFKDQGIGIPNVDLPNIFMKFFRTHSVKTSTIKGSGLGLYLAKYFVELHKGKINVESALGKGSLFIVELSLDT